MMVRSRDSGGSGGAVRVAVRAKPRAKKSRVVRADGLTIEVALAAPPVDGAANEELISVLAESLSVPARAIRLVIGAGSKNKVVEVTGLSETEIVARLSSAVSAQHR
jgi:uncharacterized protein (TIGR00251 family)